MTHPREQIGIDVLFDVAGEQEPPAIDGPEQHDRDVVDAGAGIGRSSRDTATNGPEHLERDVVNGQAITRSKLAAGCGPAGEHCRPGGVPGTRSKHPGFERPANAVPLEQQRQPRHVVLVRVGEHHRIKATIPRWDPLIEFDQQAIGIRTAVDEQPSAVRALDEDRVPLANVEDRDGRTSRRSLDDDCRREHD